MGPVGSLVQHQGQRTHRHEEPLHHRSADDGAGLARLRSALLKGRPRHRRRAAAVGVDVCGAPTFSRHHHTLLAATDYTANALDDKDWPVLRKPDMDEGLSLFAPRVLEGVSGMCDAP